VKPLEFECAASEADYRHLTIDPYRKVALATWRPLRPVTAPFALLSAKGEQGHDSGKQILNFETQPARNATPYGTTPITKNPGKPILRSPIRFSFALCYGYPVTRRKLGYG